VSGDTVERGDQPFALERRHQTGDAAFVPVVQPARAHEQPPALVGEMQAVRAAVARHAPHQAALLQAVEQRHEIRLLDPKRRARVRLQQPRIRVDDGQQRELPRPQVELSERVDEILEDPQLREPQRVAHVLAERSELSGDLGNERIHRTGLSRRSGLTPAALHGYIA